MELKIALITNQSIHHKYWAYMLYKSLNVKLIIHPITNKSLQSFVIKRDKVLKGGFLKAFLKILSIIYNKTFSDSREKKFFQSSKKMLGDYEQNYEKIPKGIFHFPNSINEDSVIELIRENKIDYIFFLGGGIAKSKLINSPKFKTVNFHSGVSPYYNGNKTIFHAFKNKDFNLIGGTLMYMTEKIDGGSILMHTFPSIDQVDNSSTLFLKNIELSVQAIIQFTEEHIKEGYSPSSVIQDEPKYYLKNIDWDIRDDIKLSKLESSFHQLKIKRDKAIINYFDLGSHQAQIMKKRLKPIIGQKHTD